MKKYWRWIVFGAVAVGLIALWLLLSSNKKLRQKIEALILERFITNKVSDIKDQAANVRAKGETNEESAHEAEQEAADLEKQIEEQKKKLEEGLKSRGHSAEDISNRINNLNI